MVSYRPSASSRVAVPVVAALLCLALLSACGGSSKPAYCAQIDALKKSVSSVNASTITSPSTLLSTFNQVKAEATALASTAKSAFPKEIAALQSSLAAVSKSIQQLTTSPATAAAALLGQAETAIGAAKDLENAAKSSCS
jgi:hypothetical protein